MMMDEMLTGVSNSKDKRSLHLIGRGNENSVLGMFMFRFL